eukprot:TRINITY_DN1925_c1_g1_i1.p1 TRINITY_DN1925_c1_g1~~TRINITY_DN1925_c1_g1_i1.p1  ORF type:complete len:752 (-),score=200.58 TRINITY_DN1925_c1_g1_i1:1218-3446(-)
MTQEQEQLQQIFAAAVSNEGTATASSAMVDDVKDQVMKTGFVDEAAAASSAQSLSWDELKSKSWRDVEEFLGDEPCYSRWLGELCVGDMVDVLDLKEKWYPAYILAIREERYHIHFQGWASKWDEWIGMAEKRIAPLNSHLYSILQSEERAVRPMNKFVTNPFAMLESYSYDKFVINNVREMFYNTNLADMAVLTPRSKDSEGRVQMYEKTLIHKALIRARCPGLFNHLVLVEEAKANTVPTVNSQAGEDKVVPLFSFGKGIDVDSELFGIVLQFVYFGGMNPVFGRQVSKLLNVFSSFDVSGFTDLAISWVNTTNVVDFLEVIFESNFATSMPRLVDHCLDIFRENAGNLINLPGVNQRLQRLPASVLVGLLQNIVPQLNFANSSSSKKRRRSSDVDFPVLRRRLNAQDSPLAGEERNNDAEGNTTGTSSTDESKSLVIETNFAHVTMDIFFMDTPVLLQYISDLDRLFFSRSPATCDMEIQVGEYLFYAHSSILASQSAFFSALVLSPMQDKREVRIGGLFELGDSFAHILRFMYSGFVGDMPIANAIDILRKIDFFGIRSQVLKRTCRAMIVNKANENNLVQLLQMSMNSLEEPSLFSTIVSRLTKMNAADRERVIDSIADAKILKAALKAITRQSEDEIMLGADGGDDVAHNVSENQSKLFVLSDELSAVLEGRDCACIHEIVAFVQENVNSSEMISAETAVTLGDKISPLLGGRTHVHARNGSLCSLLSRHLTRVRL